MDQFEIAYYLDGQQMLLLLSLIDQTPVAGLPRIAEPEDWRKVALSLLQEGRLRCEDGQLVMDEGLSDLLITMKESTGIYAVHTKRLAPASQVLYEGERPVLVQFLPDGKYRLRQMKMWEFRQMLEERLAPHSPMPETLMETLPDDPALQECLARWKGQKITLEDSPGLWYRFSEVCGILEHQTPETQTRWIWVEDIAADLVLRQERNGIHAELDTASQRRSLLRELGLEE